VLADGDSLVQNHINIENKRIDHDANSPS
jgi:hypothetical protein